jgi:2-C-methyl-D-erythritol 4-phosphate cytidylyltransferase
MKVYVIIPAAGLGTRMSSVPTKSGALRSKQFLELDGLPIVIHTLKKFEACNAVDSITIAMRKSEADAFAPELNAAKIAKPVKVVEGGEHRQQSVANALDSLAAAADDIVLVHDAVRPFIEIATIEGVVEAVKKFGAAIAGVPAVDTIKRVERTQDGAIIRTTIPREQVVQAQTPQGFWYGELKKAFDDARAEGFQGTDEASLMERAGRAVHVVMGSARNIKITTPGDLELAEFFLKQAAK